MSAEQAGTITIVIGVLLVFAGIAIIRGKATFLVSGYKRYDKDRTDFEKVHWANGCVTVVAGALLAIGGIVLMLTHERTYGIACAMLAVAVMVGLLIYEKTGDRYSL